MKLSRRQLLRSAPILAAGALACERRADPYALAKPIVAGTVGLPRGHEREHVHYHGHDYTLRGSVSRTLSSVGAFRVVPANDLRDTFDKPLDPRHGELWHLRESGLVHTVRIDRDTSVVTLTKEGRELLESRRWTRTLPIANGKSSMTASRDHAN